MKNDPQTYAVIGAAMEVHRVLGPGFHEVVYQAALARELAARDVPFQREVEIVILYKGERLEASFRVDFLCFVELKALDALTGREQSQALNYLKATTFPKCLLFNFGAVRLEYQRFVGRADSSSSETSASSVDLTS